MSIANGLAERIHGVRYDTLPQDGLHWARAAVLATVGVTLTDASEPCAHIAARVLARGRTDRACPDLRQRPSRGDARCRDDQRHRSHALDVGDCSNTLGGHSSALFALAETLEVDRRLLPAATIAVCETEARISRGISFHHCERGSHPTATIGIFGGAAGCAHLLGLPAQLAAA
jgi:2-methylcitrate dehydratase PrpD